MHKTYIMQYYKYCIIRTKEAMQPWRAWRRPKIRARIGPPSAIPASSQRSNRTTITISDERPRLAAFGPGFSVEPRHHHSRAATRPGSGIQVLSFPHSRSPTPARSPTCPSDGDTRYHRGRWSQHSRTGSPNCGLVARPARIGRPRWPQSGNLTVKITPS